MDSQLPLEFDSQDLIFSRGDSNDLRIGESLKHGMSVAETVAELAKSPGYCLWGYPDDEGI